MLGNLNYLLSNLMRNRGKKTTPSYANPYKNGNTRTDERTGMIYDSYGRPDILRMREIEMDKGTLPYAPDPGFSIIPKADPNYNYKPDPGFAIKVENDKNFPYRPDPGFSPFDGSAFKGRNNKNKWIDDEERIGKLPNTITLQEVKNQWYTDEEKATKSFNPSISNTNMQFEQGGNINNKNKIMYKMKNPYMEEGGQPQINREQAIVQQLMQAFTQLSPQGQQMFIQGLQQMIQGEQSEQQQEPQQQEGTPQDQIQDQQMQQPQQRMGGYNNLGFRNLPISVQQKIMRNS